MCLHYALLSVYTTCAQPRHRKRNRDSLSCMRDKSNSAQRTSCYVQHTQRYCLFPQGVELKHISEEVLRKSGHAARQHKRMGAKLHQPVLAPPWVTEGMTHNAQSHHSASTRAHHADNYKSSNKLTYRATRWSTVVGLARPVEQAVQRMRRPSMRVVPVLCRRWWSGTLVDDLGHASLVLAKAGRRTHHSARGKP